MLHKKKSSGVVSEVKVLVAHNNLIVREMLYNQISLVRHSRDQLKMT